MECIKELIGNPTFRNHIRYAPERVYEDEDGISRIFDEIWTADWWWNVQVGVFLQSFRSSLTFVSQKFLPPGATVAPVILASDKTQLSRHSGDKSAWPVYLMIGNIKKSIRRKPSERAMILIGYLPVTKMECFKIDRRAGEVYQLFHKCMRSLLDPLIKAGMSGVEMTCADGGVRLVFPLVAAYIADHPEQCLVACCKESRCPRCVVQANDRGAPTDSAYRDPKHTLQLISDNNRGWDDLEFNSQGLRKTIPFWLDLPHCNIFSCITPDILHQLHKGFFKDHIVKWSTRSAARGEAEID